MHRQAWVSKSPDPVQDPTVTSSVHPSSNYRKWEEAASALSYQKSYPGTISDVRLDIDAYLKSVDGNSS